MHSDPCSSDAEKEAYYTHYSLHITLSIGEYFPEAEFKLSTTPIECTMEEEDIPKDG